MFTHARQPSFALILALAWAVIAAQLLFQHWGSTAVALNDTDDAMRLVQMRSFLAGQGWFDLHLSRVQPPIGLDSHWSRLIDAGLAGLFLFFNMFVDAPFAERLMRSLWPLLWLIPALAGAAAIAWRIAGREAALVALLLATVGMPAYNQFQPGRIDHHNVQIALSVLTVAATVWADRVHWMAAAAGLLTALALAIGFEGMPIVVLCGAAFAVRYALDKSPAAALHAYGLALAAGLVVAFGAGVDRAKWLTSACDMIAFNSAVPAALGGLMLAALAYPFAQGSRALRCIFVGVAGALSLVLFASLEPRCLSGPFAMMDPALWSVWLAHVNEMQPLLRLMRHDTVTGAWIASFPLVTLVASVVLLLRAPELRRDAAFLIAAAVFVLAAAIMLATVKGAPYAVWLGIPLVAVLALHLSTALRLRSMVARFAVGMLLTPTVIAAVAISLAAAAGQQSTAGRDHAKTRTCFETATYAPLAKLPPGVVAANVDYGPFVLALTTHDVVAAPYHRLSVGIMAAHQIFAEPPAVARDILARFRASYLVTCGPNPPLGLDESQRAASLWGQLQAGHPPDWLEPVAEAQGQPLRIYRINDIQLAGGGPRLARPNVLTSVPAGVAQAARPRP